MPDRKMNPFILALIIAAFLFSAGLTALAVLVLVIGFVLRHQSKALKDLFNEVAQSENNDGNKVYQDNSYNNPMKNFNIDELRKRSSFALIGVILLLILIKAITIIPAGHTGVYHVFGKVRDRELSSGIHLINPLASVVTMSIRTEQYTMSVTQGEGQRRGDDAIDALTKEGLKIRLDITVLFHLLEERASDVYKELGRQYEEKIIRPLVRSSIREVVALYEAKDIYSENREDVTEQIFQDLSAALDERGIVVESVLIRNVALPELLTSAIEEKLTAEQEAQRYDFVLEREEKEAERKRIEAEGRRDAQRIINSSLTDRYLQFLYINELKDREGTIYVPTDLPLFRGL